MPRPSTKYQGYDFTDWTPVDVQTVRSRTASKDGWLRLDSASNKDGKETPLPVTVIIRYTRRKGALVWSGVHLETQDGQMASALLREIPLGTLAEYARGYFEMTNKDLSRGKKKPRLGDDFYEGVVADYRAALQRHPGRPVKAVAEERGLTPSTIHKYLREARAKGLL